MPKRKRNNASKSKYTASPLGENSGQRSAFPEVVAQLSTTRDTEWRYDDDGQTQEPSVNEPFLENESHLENTLVGHTLSFDQLDFGEEEDEGEEGQAEEEEEEEEERPGAVIGEVEDDEWEVEPQTEALAYLQTVRNEADSLPALRYVPHDVHQTNGVNGVNGSTPLFARSPIATTGLDPWKTQFLQYYKTLRSTIANAETPNYTQDELDSLLHINPSKRPQTSSDEDTLWRFKTLDPPSIPLLSMLDHQRTLHLLTHLRKKMSANVKEEQCIWLVFLLARLGDPGVLSGEEVDLLRRIGRKCLSVRKEEEGREVVLGTIDMVVCIITEYYVQRDLEETA